MKFVAKIASARCKPDGLLVVPGGGPAGLPAPAAGQRAVGRAATSAEEVLARLGLRTIGDIAHVPLDTLQRELGAAGEHLWALAWGRDERRVVPRREEKSVGAEETFPADVDDPEVIRRELLRLSDRTARSLRAAGCVAKTVTVKLRLASFKTITRSRTLPEPTDVARVIYATACALYEGSGLDGRARLRLVGVRAAGPAAGLRTAVRSWRSVTGRWAGGRRSRRWTRSRAGSAAARCGRRPSFRWTAPTASRPHRRRQRRQGRPASAPGREPPAPAPSPAAAVAPFHGCVRSLVSWEMNQVRK